MHSQLFLLLILIKSMSVNATPCYYMTNMWSRQQTKTKTNIVFVCKTYYIKCLLSELVVENNSSNKAYTATTLSKEEIVENHISACAILFWSLPKTMIVIYVLDS